MKDCREKLRLVCLDHDTFGADDPLGNIEIDVAALQLGVPFQQWHKLQGVAHGDLHVRITVLPQSAVKTAKTGAGVAKTGKKTGKAAKKTGKALGGFADALSSLSDM